jgi:hypothetical protein
MQKLINAYKAEPTDKNACKAYAYYNKHAMSACLLSDEDGDTLTAIILHYRRIDNANR